MNNIMFTSPKRISFFGNVWAMYRLNRHTGQPRRDALNTALKIAAIIEDVHRRTVQEPKQLTPEENIQRLEREASNCEAWAEKKRMEVKAIRIQIRQQRAKQREEKRAADVIPTASIPSNFASM